MHIEYQVSKQDYVNAATLAVRKGPISSGMRLVTSESETRSTWKTYSKFAESSRVFILFHLGSKTFIPIPKSALNSEQVTELRSFFKTSLAR